MGAPPQDGPGTGHGFRRHSAPTPTRQGLWAGLDSRHGVLARRSSGTVERWTFDGASPRAPAGGVSQAAADGQSPKKPPARAPAGGTWRYLNASGRREEWGRLEANCHGALVGLDTSKPAARAFLAAWLDCALHLECIAPPGSHRGNHRQDQAAFTLLVLLSKERFGVELGCADLGKLPLGGDRRGVSPDQLENRAAEYAPNWPKLAARYAACLAAPALGGGGTGGGDGDEAGGGDVDPEGDFHAGPMGPNMHQRVAKGGPKGRTRVPPPAA